LIIGVLGIFGPYSVVGGFVIIGLTISVVALGIIDYDGIERIEGLRRCHQGRNWVNAKPIIQVGIALILFGIAALIYPGVTRTSEERIVEIAKQRVSIDNQRLSAVSPLLGGLALLSGVLLIIVGIKVSSRR
jgi:hypothetical protein